MIRALDHGMDIIDRYVDNLKKYFRRVKEAFFSDFSEANYKMSRLYATLLALTLLLALILNKVQTDTSSSVINRVPTSSANPTGNR